MQISYALAAVTWLFDILKMPSSYAMPLIKLVMAGENQKPPQVSPPLRPLAGKNQEPSQVPARAACIEACYGGEKPKTTTNSPLAQLVLKLVMAGRNRKPPQIPRPLGLC